MAMKKTTMTSPWDDPIWPVRLPDPFDMRVIYGEIADELVIRFSPNPNTTWSSWFR
jgi:hypothetical protein